MAYATYEDFVAMYGAHKVALLSSRVVVSGGDTPRTAIARALELSSVAIDGYLDMAGYITPVRRKVPPIFRHFACREAWYRLDFQLTFGTIKTTTKSTDSYDLTSVMDRASKFDEDIECEENKTKDTDRNVSEDEKTTQQRRTVDEGTVEERNQEDLSMDPYFQIDRAEYIAYFDNVMRGVILLAIPKKDLTEILGRLLVSNKGAGLDISGYDIYGHQITIVSEPIAIGYGFAILENKDDVFLFVVPKVESWGFDRRGNVYVAGDEFFEYRKEGTDDWVSFEDRNSEYIMSRDEEGIVTVTKVDKDTKIYLRYRVRNADGAETTSDELFRDGGISRGALEGQGDVRVTALLYGRVSLTWEAFTDFGLNPQGIAFDRKPERYQFEARIFGTDNVVSWDAFLSNLDMNARVAMFTNINPVHAYEMRVVAYNDDDKKAVGVWSDKIDFSVVPRRTAPLDKQNLDLRYTQNADDVINVQWREPENKGKDDIGADVLRVLYSFYKVADDGGRIKLLDEDVSFDATGLRATLRNVSTGDTLVLRYTNDYGYGETEPTALTLQKLSVAPADDQRVFVDVRPTGDERVYLQWVEPSDLGLDRKGEVITTGLSYQLYVSEDDVNFVLVPAKDILSGSLLNRGVDVKAKEGVDLYYKVYYTTAGGTGASKSSDATNTSLYIVPELVAGSEVTLTDSLHSYHVRWKKASSYGRKAADGSSYADTDFVYRVSFCDAATKVDFMHYDYEASYFDDVAAPKADDFLTVEYKIRNIKKDGDYLDFLVQYDRQNYVDMELCFYLISKDGKVAQLLKRERLRHFGGNLTRINRLVSNLFLQGGLEYGYSERDRIRDFVDDDNAHRSFVDNAYENEIFFFGDQVNLLYQTIRDGGEFDLHGFGFSGVYRHRLKLSPTSPFKDETEFFDYTLANVDNNQQSTARGATFEQRVLSEKVDNKTYDLYFLLHNEATQNGCAFVFGFQLYFESDYVLKLKRKVSRYFSRDYYYSGAYTTDQFHNSIENADLDALLVGTASVDGVAVAAGLLVLKADADLSTAKGWKDENLWVAGYNASARIGFVGLGLEFTANKRKARAWTAVTPVTKKAFADGNNGFSFTTPDILLNVQGSGVGSTARSFELNNFWLWELDETKTASNFSYTVNKRALSSVFPNAVVENKVTNFDASISADVNLKATKIDEPTDKRRYLMYGDDEYQSVCVGFYANNDDFGV